MRDRILLINYDFPPVLSGVRRIVKMAKYLPEHGFDPIVLCATPPAGSTLDFDPLDELEGSDCEVYRTSSPDLYHIGNLRSAVFQPLKKLRARLDLSAVNEDYVEVPRASEPGRLRRGMPGLAKAARRLLSLPDDRFPWLATAIPMAEHLLRSRAIRYVLTSSYPNSSHLVGLYLARKYDIHWHADFRDGWTQNPYFADYATPLHRHLSASLERQVAESAHTISAVSEPIADHLAELSGVDNTYLLPNGFDLTDLDDVPVIDFDKFTLAYTGTMFMQRSPDSFFAAVRGLLDCYPGLVENFQIVFRSNIKPEHEAMIRELGLGGVIVNWGIGSWKESLSLQKSADALLVLEGESPNSHIMLTQKVFEYLAAEKPILAIAPPGALADLVRSTRAGVVIEPDNVFRIKETLFELFLGRLQFTRNEELISSFTRQHQAADLARILRG